MGFHSCRTQVLKPAQIHHVKMLLATNNNSPALSVAQICLQIAAWHLAPKMLSKIHERQQKKLFFFQSKVIK